jgi:Cu/Ag efflux pump CusA
MTTTPALCALLLRRHDARPESGWLRRLKALQTRAVHGVATHFTAVTGSVIVCVLAAAAALPFLGGTFMPDFREGHLVIQSSSSIPGTSFDEMLAVGRKLSAEVLALPYVAMVTQQVGRAELGEDTWGPHRSEFHVELKADTDVDQSAAQDALRRIVGHYPGLQSEVVDLSRGPDQ